MAAKTFFSLQTPWGSFVERSGDELTARIWTDASAYKARRAPSQTLSWDGEIGLSTSRAFFANGDAVPEPELDPIPQPSESDIAKAELAARDAAGEDIRIIEDLWSWAKANGFTPAAAADKRVTDRKAIREKIK